MSSHIIGYLPKTKKEVGLLKLPNGEVNSMIYMLIPTGHHPSMFANLCELPTTRIHSDAGISLGYSLAVECYFRLVKNSKSRCRDVHDLFLLEHSDLAIDNFNSLHPKSGISSTVIETKISELKKKDHFEYGSVPIYNRSSLPCYDEVTNLIFNTPKVIYQLP
jgi:hypothetical protein